MTTRNAYAAPGVKPVTTKDVPFTPRGDASRRKKTSSFFSSRSSFRFFSSPRVLSRTTDAHGSGAYGYRLSVVVGASLRHAPTSTSYARDSAARLEASSNRARNRSRLTASVAFSFFPSSAPRPGKTRDVRGGVHARRTSPGASPGEARRGNDARLGGRSGTGASPRSSQSRVSRAEAGDASSADTTAKSANRLAERRRRAFVPARRGIVGDASGDTGCGAVVSDTRDAQ